jgi:hypothetical protein
LPDFSGRNIPERINFELPTKLCQGQYGVPLLPAPLLLMGIGSRHKTKGHIWLHRGPQHGVIGTARWQQHKNPEWVKINQMAIKYANWT